MTDDSENPLLYGPKDGQSLLRTYPELAEIPELKVIRKDELYFAWLMGIKYSPVDEDIPQENIRIRMAAEKAFKNDKDKRAQFDKSIPVEVRAAIKVFQRFDPDIRLEAKKTAAKAFKQMKELMEVDIKNDFWVTKTIGKGEDKEEIREMNWTGRKAHADILIKINDALPSIVKRAEEGFGITEKKKDSETRQKSIDIFHRDKGKSNS